MSELKKAIVSLLVLAVLQTAFSAQVEINTDFPGGNVIVVSNQGATVIIKPDLRGDGDWFYWYIEAKATETGRVTFDLPGSDTSCKYGKQGPAVSYDQGETWSWLGADHCNTTDGSFFFDFNQANQIVRFSVTIPYLQKELGEFLARNAANPHLRVSTLCEGHKNAGRNVQLLQIGQPGAGKKQSW